MLGSQQFCVRWNSYQTNLQDVFPKLLNSEHFVDVTLACEAQMIKCHKVVLSACSTYFEELLVKNPCQHPIIFMKDMKHWEVQALVDFMYKGEVNVTQEEISTLLKAAEALQIRGLCGADRQQDSNAVSLPPETTLSDSGGRETPPVKRRKLPEQQAERNERREKQQPRAPTPKPTNSTSGPSPLVTSTPTSSSNDTASALGASGPVTASVTSAPYRDSERNNTGKESNSEDVQDRSSIKREQMDQDDSYFDNEGDYDSFDIQDDSNSMNPDISMPTSPLDQAGPSGVPGMQETKPTAGRRPDMHQQLLPHGLPHGGHGGPHGLGMHGHAGLGVPGVPVESVLSTPTFSAGDFDHEHPGRMNMGMGMGMMGMGGVPGGVPGGPLGGNLGSPGKARIRRSEEQLRQAADCVVEGSTFQTVSDRFGIPISTIRFYMARRGILPQRRRGRSSAASGVGAPAPAPNNQSLSAVNPFHQMP